MGFLKRAFLSPLTRVYGLLMRADRATRRCHELKAPVLSVGNIAMGGRAKTPLVIELCRRLRARGLEPVVLTRGYGRRMKRPFWIRVRESQMVIEDPLGASAANEALSPAEVVGDEALEVAWSARCAVLVGARRSENARRFLERHPELCAG